MKAHLLSVLLAAATAGMTSTQATFPPAKPSLSLACALPTVQHVVSCRLSGRGFRPRERVSITYRVTYLALATSGGKHPERVYRRTGRAGNQGSFVRPPLGFTVQPGHESYAVTAEVTGASGDRAAITFTAIAQ